MKQVDISTQQITTSRLGILARKVNAVLIYLALLLPLFVFWPMSKNVFLLPKNTIFLLLGALLFLFLIIYLVESKDENFSKEQKIILSLLGLWLFLKLVSLVFSPDKQVSFFGGLSRFEGLTLFIALTVFFICFIITFKNQDKIKRLLLIVSLAGGLCAIYGIMQKLGIFLFNESWLEENVSRVTSLFGNPLYFSSFLVPIIFITFYSLRQKEHKNLKAELIVCLLAQLIALFLAESSSAFLTFFLTVFIFLVIFFWPTKRKISISILIVFIILAGIFVSGIASNSILPASIQQIFSDFNINKASNIQRLFAWQSAGQAFFAKPIFGWGNEMFTEAFNSHRNANLIQPLEANFDRAHNTFLDILVTEGLLVFVAFMAILFFSLVRGFKKYKQNKDLLYLICGLIIIAYVINFFFSIPVLANYLILFLALAIIFCRQTSQSFIEQKAKRSRIVGYVVVTVIVVFAGYYLTLPMQASSNFYYALQAPDLSVSKQFFDQAFAKWQFKEMAISRLTVQGKLVAASQDKESLKAQSQELIDCWSQKYYYSYLYWQVAGLAYSFYDKETMNSYFQQAIALAPNSYETYWDWGDACLQQNDQQQARQRYQQAIDIDPEQPFPYFKMSQLFQKINDKKQAQDFSKIYKELMNNYQYYK